MSNAITINQLLELIPISRAKLYELFKKGEGPRCFFIGRRRFVTEVALNAWVKSLEDEGKSNEN